MAFLWLTGWLEGKVGLTNSSLMMMSQSRFVALLEIVGKIEVVVFGNEIDVVGKYDYFCSVF